jgi:hypothetical protein
VAAARSAISASKPKAYARLAQSQRAIDNMSAVCGKRLEST